MAVTTLFFLRHGETDYNKRGIVQGSGVDSDLNETGISQAQAFFSYYRHLGFDAIIGSRLRRTHQTLAPWCNSGYQLEVAPGLNELGWGIHEGKVPTAEQHKDFLSIKDRWAQGEVDLRVPEGESPVEGWRRGFQAIEEIHETHRGKHLLICSHGRQLRVLLSGLLCGDLSKMEVFKQPNTGLHVLEMKDPRRFRVHTLADVRHLEGGVNG